MLLFNLKAILMDSNPLDKVVELYGILLNHLISRIIFCIFAGFQNVFGRSFTKSTEKGKIIYKPPHF